MANFNTVPRIHAPRSRFDLSFSNKTSGNVGTLYPIYCQEIYPGDSFDCTATVVTRLSSAYIRPVMDDLYLDIYFFFVPARLCFNQWQEIFGENTQSAWVQPSPVAAPVWSYDSSLDGDIVFGSVADHLGLPLTDNANGLSLPDKINIIPFRAFALVYDQWFRDENIIAPMQIYKGAFTHVAEYFNNSDWSAHNYFGMCPKVSKFHDYFTSALPGPLKATEGVSIPVRGFAPVVGGPTPHSLGSNGVIFAGDFSGSANNKYLVANNVPAAGPIGKVFGTPSSGANTTNVITETNLVADLAASGVMATVNDLRYAFQLQKILERSARSGSRYTEYLLAAFGIQSPDARLQRAEYLGGKRIPLSVQQVAQTTRDDSSGAETLASLGAFSLSNGKCGYSKAFVEHGFVLGVMCLRQRHDYQQAVEKFWSRSERFSYYDPTFANIGEQPVYKDEIYALHDRRNGESVNINSTPFGYQEAWADLRYRPNMITGQMRSSAANSLDIWHFGDDYANAPTLNKAWLEETPDNVDRTIAVPSSSLDQFIFDIYFKNIGTRRLPMYSVPSLIDHN